MHFVSFPFAGFFLAVFAGYWLLRVHRLRMLWLLAASCLFYASWNPWLIVLILCSASVDYVAALAIERSSSPTTRRRLVVLSVSINLGLLAFFKYATFALDNFAAATNFLGIDFEQPVFKIALPLGISFYTFEAISYVVDVYRGKTRALRNVLDYALYIMFFPHLLAGPIVRPAHFLPQIERPKRWSWPRLYLGSRLFLLGTFKKALLADYLAGVVDPTFKDPGSFGSTSLWLAVLAYALQVYGDFSGYSDMAIGLAHMFGFKLAANFRLPYFSANIAEFWKRWHISLSSWLRDYLFIPLGGSRGGEWATCRNLIATMFLGGLWHGATWPAVLWGTYHGVLLAGHRVLASRNLTTWFRPVGIPCTFFACCLGLAIFRSQSIGDVGVVLHRLFVPTEGAILDRFQVMLVLGGAFAVLAEHALGTWGRLPQLERLVPAPLMGAVCATLVIAAAMLLPEANALFIYFQF